MNKKVRWGILGAAKIAIKDVIPAMQTGKNCEISAIASRNLAKAKQVANDLNISKYYGSYEELIADAEIEAIYIPLPNHLHLEWATKSAMAGKHVLCEKPLAMNAEEVRKLIEIRNQTGVKIQEAFIQAQACITFITCLIFMKAPALITLRGYIKSLKILPVQPG